jgi:DNA damage-binding protein 1
VLLQVIIFTLKQEDLYSITECELLPFAEWNHNYFVLCLVAHDNKLIIGDAISSISVLTLEGSVLRTLARDYGALWPISLGMLDDNTVIGANVRIL